MEHVANNFLSIGGALSGTTNPPMGADENPPDAWARAKEAFVPQLDTADLSVPVEGPFGPMPAEQLIGRLIATDLLVHTWDLARPLAGTSRCPPTSWKARTRGSSRWMRCSGNPVCSDRRWRSRQGSDVQTEFLGFVGRRA